MDEAGATVIACLPVELSPDPFYADSLVVACADCGQDVWLSLPLEPALAWAEPLCLPCLNARGGEPLVLMPEEVPRG